MAEVICKRCLLRDMEDGEYYESVKKYRASLAEKHKCPDELYEKRLSECMACDQLVNGVCSQCGCYVEMRAAAVSMSCPATSPRW